MVALQTTCDACGTIYAASQVKCPNCGEPHSAKVPMSLSGAREVTDLVELSRAYAGADLVCGSCGVRNHAGSTTCKQCGSPLDDAEQFHGGITDEPPTKPVHRSNQSRPSSTGEQIQPTFDIRSGASRSGGVSGGSSYQSPTRLPLPIQRYSAYGTSHISDTYIPWQAIGIVATFVLLMTFLLWPHQETVTVTGFTRERSVTVQAYQWVPEEDWEDNVPSGAITISSRRAQRSTEQVEVGQEWVDPPPINCKPAGEEINNLYNGFAKITPYEECDDPPGYYEPVYEDQPVYDTKVSYKIQKWVTVQRGTDRIEGKTSSWHSYGASGQKVDIGAIRYIVVLQMKEDASVRDKVVSEQDWNLFHENMTLVARMNRIGGMYSLTLVE
ncbi:hypothetical protein CO180_02410 [candidate division WWE3 bacterium CG_4_9_14_3_um_filter_41_6]|nr:MAG: hypothetical protein CO180_02410 [candidate division WWE3 bacterium CG_4_9_14_3_um_filter_41_6]